MYKIRLTSGGSRICWGNKPCGNRLKTFTSNLTCYNLSTKPRAYDSGETPRPFLPLSGCAFCLPREQPRGPTPSPRATPHLTPLPGQGKALTLARLAACIAMAPAGRGAWGLAARWRRAALLRPRRLPQRGARMRSQQAPRSAPQIA